MNDRSVRLVDMAEKFDWTRHTIKDKVHPNAEGADIMVSVWLEELKKVLPKPKTEYKPEHHLKTDNTQEQLQKPNTEFLKPK